MKDTNPDGKIEPKQLEAVRKEFKGYQPPSRYAPIIELLADIIDTAASGRTCYCTFGLSRSGDLIMLTVTYAGSKLYASGRDLVELGEAAKSLV